MSKIIRKTNSMSTIRQEVIEILNTFEKNKGWDDDQRQSYLDYISKEESSEDRKVASLIVKSMIEDMDYTINLDHIRREAKSLIESLEDTDKMETLSAIAEDVSLTYRERFIAQVAMSLLNV